MKGTTGKEIDPNGIVHPQHYNQHPCGLEVCRVTDHLDFNLGCLFKYVIRCDAKDGVRDLKKALWYAEQEKSNDWRHDFKHDVPEFRKKILHGALCMFIGHESDLLVQHVIVTLRELLYEEGNHNALITSIKSLIEERENG
jgi:hypothetical protein